MSDKINNSLTYVSLIIDKSGSMTGSEKFVINSCNEQLQMLKAKTDLDIKFSFVTFNGDVFEHPGSSNIQEFPELTLEDYKPNGSTALFDAIGHVVYKYKKIQEESKDDISFLLVIITDGEENASIHVNQSRLCEEIESLQKSGKWTFTMMGCSKDYLKELSRKTSIPLSNMAAWSNKDAKHTVKGMSLYSANLGNYLRQRSFGSGCSLNYCCGIDDQMADYTTNECSDSSMESPKMWNKNAYQNNTLKQVF